MCRGWRTAHLPRAPTHTESISQRRWRLKSSSDYSPSSAQARRRAPVAIVCCPADVPPIFPLDGVAMPGRGLMGCDSWMKKKRKKEVVYESNPTGVYLSQIHSRWVRRCASVRLTSPVSSCFKKKKAPLGSRFLLDFTLTYLLFIADDVSVCQAPGRPNPLPVYYASETAEAIHTRSPPR